MVTRVWQQRFVRWPVLATVLAGVCLSAATAAAQQPAGDAAEAAAIEDLLRLTADAFTRKDTAAVKHAFVENFAAPLQMRAPSVTRQTLDRLMQAAEGVDANFDMLELMVVPPRAMAIVDLELRFAFKGENKLDVTGLFMVWLDKDGMNWSISGVERLAEDWEPAENAPAITWADQAVTFPVPEGWGIYPLASPETLKGVLFVAPDLRAAITVAVVELPLAVTLEAVVSGQRAVDKLFPGSKFLGQEPCRVAGEAAVMTEIDMKLGSAPTRIQNTMMVKSESERLYIAVLAVKPVADLADFAPVYSRVCNGLTLTGTPVKADRPVSGKVEAGRYTNDEAGISFKAPDGWTIQPMPQRVVERQKWALGVSLKPAKGNSFIVVGGRKMPGGMPLGRLQRMEQNQMQSIIEDLQVRDVKETKVAGLPALAYTYAFDLGQPRCKRHVLVRGGDMLYFAVAEVIPAPELESVQAALEAVLTSLQIRVDTERKAPAK